MAKESLKAKHRIGAKFNVRNHNRCAVCGRPRGFLRRFDMCRICFRKFAAQGKIPGVTKSSW
ncbi:MAG: type Z 30S ribosomal protein S14 [Spirochaetes bacterium]|jgi:small subunit ribosomal protein S14|nr:type Z 30S ribosomal protein S14 [Spirochaetota bacterium]